MRRIAVLGGGFGGFHAARHLQRLLASRRRVELTVVSDRTHFLYKPLLAKVATGELDPSHITFPLRAEFDKSTELIFERIEEIDLKARRLRGANRVIPFDYLLVACGARVDWSARPKWRRHALTLHHARDATRLRDTIGEALLQADSMACEEARRRHLTFVVGGAGPTGVELAAELTSAIEPEHAPPGHKELVSAMRIVLIEQQQRLLPRWPDALGRIARSRLGSRGLECRLGTEVVDRGAGRVELSTGEVIEADHFLWCGGVRPSELVSTAAFECDQSGRVLVDSRLRAKGHTGVYVIGDAAAPEPAVEQTAGAAVGQAAVAARNIVAELSGQACRSWTPRPPRYLLSLGDDDALAYMGETAIEGRAARTLYRVVHTALMPSALKKARLLREWLFGNAPRTGRAWRVLDEGDSAPAKLEPEDSSP